MVPFIDLTRQYKTIEEEILSATKKVYEKGRFILGEEVSAFEEEFSRYCGVRFGVGVDSGTNALHLALKAADIGEGDEVITVAHSFVATALAISLTGAKPLFVDIDPETYTMDPNALEHFLRHRNTLHTFLEEKGVGTLIHYPIPIHLQKAFRELGYRRGNLPLTEQYARELLSLPLFPEMAESEIEEVATQIKLFVGQKSPADDED